MFNNYTTATFSFCLNVKLLQCFDIVGWASETASSGL